MTVERPEVPGALDGVRVVELGVWIAGPATGCVLADWGADVVKIEPPEGDPARTFARMLGADVAVNPPFDLDNRGKRSVVLDVGVEAGRELALGLVDRADVFLTNLRLEALERLGLDPDALTARNRRLVYAILTGYGLAGDEQGRAGYDVSAYWARSGIAGLLTAPGEPPPFQRGGMGDHTAAVTLAGAVAAALYARDRTGEGQVVSTSLLRQGAYTIGFDLSVSLGVGRTVALGSRTTMANPLVNSYRSGDDRWFWLVCLESDRHWPDLLRAVDRPAWQADDRFATAESRAANTAGLVAELDAVFAGRTRDEWGAIFDREDVWWAPVQSVEELLADPQAHAAGVFAELTDGAGTSTVIATPADFSATPSRPRSPAPTLGQHTAGVLAELGAAPPAVPPAAP